MSSKVHKEARGFTIIEVMIVLLIAGLIMLIVFLAIPALRRNSRNTQRTNDASALLAGVTEFANNNRGQLPNSWNTGNAEFTMGSGNPNEVPVELGYYDASSVSITASVPGSHPNDEEEIVIVTGAKCNGTMAEGGSNRQFVALYTLENDAQQCQDG